MNSRYLDDRTLTVEELTPELRELGRVPNGSPARYAAVQRNGRGEVLQVMKPVAIEREEAAHVARICAANNEGRLMLPQRPRS